MVKILGNERDGLENTASLVLQKILWSIAPIAWGAFVWFMGWGLGSTLIPKYSFNYISRYVVAIAATVYFFGTSFRHAYKNYHIYIFRYAVLLPAWSYFVGLVLIASCLSATPLINYELIASLIRGVIVSAIVEELIARSFFVKYKMRLKEFIIFNTLSSLAFTYMHAFYMQESIGMHELLQRGHFSFSFMLGAVVYKTRRIELSMFLHMLSNLFRYTIPVCVFCSPWPSWLAVGCGLFVDIIFIVVLGFALLREES